MKKSIIRIICFILILAAVLFAFNSIFRMKYSDGIYTAEKYYEQEKNTVDVLFLGSSHVYENINTGTLWDEYGMASFIFAGSAQPVWNTYHFMKEALKTQNPKVIIFEGFRLVMQDEYAEDSRIIFNNFGLKWSRNKLASIKASAPKDRWADFILEYTQYHNRYTEISNEDFLPSKGNHQYDDWKGFGCNMDTKALKAKDVSNVTEREPLQEKTEKYYRLILELAQEKNIPIVVLISPYPNIKSGEQKKYNTAEDIAKEYGVPYINCNLMLEDIGLDYQFDAGDTSHLNYRGSRKLASFIGNYITSNYDIPDRRGTIGYESWQRSADYIRQMIYDQELTEEYSLVEITEKLQNPNYNIIISVDSEDLLNDESLKPLLQSLGIIDAAGSGIWYRVGDEINWYSGESETEKYVSTPYHDIGMKRIAADDGVISNSIVVDNESLVKVQGGLNIVVYDVKTDKIADAFGIDIADEYNIIR